MLAALAPVLIALAAGGESVRVAGVLRVGAADGPAAANVRVIVGEIGHATLHFNTSREMFVSTVGLSESEGRRYARVGSTDDAGRFLFTGLAPGEYTLLAADEARGAFRATVARAGAASDADVLGVLRPMARIAGEVAGLARDPQRHVLELLPEGPQGNVRFSPRLAEKPASWSFESVALPGGVTWRVLGSEVVPERGFRATRFAERVLAREGERAELRLDLGGGATLAGRVLDPEGAPLAGVSVLARQDAHERGAITGADGGYVIRGAEAGAAEVEIARWALREIAGCGNGVQDLAQRRTLTLPLATPDGGELRVAPLPASPRVGDLAPAFDVEGLDGRRVALAELRGKVVVLEYWATWCGMCRADLPALARMHAELARTGRFEIVGVSLDEDAELVPRWLASRGAAWPQVRPAPAGENALARLYNVHSTPSTVVIDAEGRIAARNVLGDELRRTVERLVAAAR